MNGDYGKILVVKWRSLGDTVLLLSPLDALKRRFPRASLHVSVPEAWKDVLEGYPGVDRIWPLRSEKTAWRRLFQMVRLWHGWRREKFDLVVNFHGSTSSAWLACLIGANARVIQFHDTSRSDHFSTIPVKSKRDKDVLLALGCSPSDIFPPRLELPNEDREAGIKYLNNIYSKPGKKPSPLCPILGLGVGASRKTKQWPLARYALLAMHWAGSTGFHGPGTVLVFTSPQERFLRTDLENHFQQMRLAGMLGSRIFSLAPETPRELMQWMSQVHVFAGNDSGPRHLAAAMGIPTLTLFGPEHPGEWHPYDSENHPFLFLDGLACRDQKNSGDAPSDSLPWCNLEECVLEGHRCMKFWGVEEVFEKCQRLLWKQPLFLSP